MHKIPGKIATLIRLSKQISKQRGEEETYKRCPKCTFTENDENDVFCKRCGDLIIDVDGL